MIFWWVIVARIAHLSILLYHPGMMFDCHKLGIGCCMAPLFMWKDKSTSTGRFEDRVALHGLEW